MNNKFVIAIFRNRSYTYGFYNELVKANIRCEIIDTPRQNFVSCGISVKFRYDDFTKANKKITQFKSNFVRYLIVAK